MIKFKSLSSSQRFPLGHISYHSGLDTDNEILLQKGVEECVLETSGSVKQSPKTPCSSNNIDTDITWFVKKMVGDSTFEVDFHIDRLAEGCFTPRRNTDIEKAVQFMRSFSEFARKVHSATSNMLRTTARTKGENMDMINTKDLFLPIFAICTLEKGGSRAIEDGLGVPQKEEDFRSLLRAQNESLGKKMVALEMQFPTNIQSSDVVEMRGVGVAFVTVEGL